jgi:hypothetical protein
LSNSSNHSHNQNPSNNTYAHTNVHNEHLSIGLIDTHYSSNSSSSNACSIQSQEGVISVDSSNHNNNKQNNCGVTVLFTPVFSLLPTSWKSLAFWFNARSKEHINFLHSTHWRSLIGNGWIIFMIFFTFNS